MIGHLTAYVRRSQLRNTSNDATGSQRQGRRRVLRDADKPTIGGAPEAALAGNALVILVGGPALPPLLRIGHKPAVYSTQGRASPARRLRTRYGDKSYRSCSSASCNNTRV